MHRQHRQHAPDHPARPLAADQQEEQKQTKNNAEIDQRIEHQNEGQGGTWKIHFFQDVGVVNEKGLAFAHDFCKQAPCEQPSTKVNAVAKSSFNTRKFGFHYL